MADQPLSLNFSDFQEIAAAQPSFVAGEKSIHPHFRNLEGRRFARLSVILYAGRLNKKQGHAYFCICDCGQKTLNLGEALTGGQIKSCGCLTGDTNRELREVHGRSHSPEWRIWANMKKRCLNPKVGCYENYGGRGIAVCARWSDSFEAFFSDMGPRPSPQHSIERRDNEGNYEPGNCVWGTRSDQVRNTRLTPRITFRGRTQSNWEWSAETGISAVQISKRIGRGWTVERALTQPLRTRA